MHADFWDKPFLSLASAKVKGKCYIRKWTLPLFAMYKISIFELEIAKFIYNIDPQVWKVWKPD